MIFSPDMEQAVRFGRKTMTRRAVRGPLRCPECRESGLGALCMECAVRTLPVEPPRYKPGKTYAVQPGRGKSATCRILVTSVHAEPVGFIDHDDAKAEGFPTGVLGFAAKWLELHDKKWPAEGQTVTDDDVLERFHGKHARTMVWVVTFQVTIPDTPRLLATTGAMDPSKARHDRDLRERGLSIPTTDHDRGYTATAARALPHEPEAVDEDTQKWITESAGTTHGQWRAQEAARHDRLRHLLSTEDRIRSARLKAARLQIDVSRETWLLQAMQARGKPDAQIQARIEVLERKVFVPPIAEAA